MIKVLKSFFYSGDDFQPPYFWITIFSLLGVVAFVLKLTGVKFLSDTLLIALWAKIIIWAGVYNWNKKNNGSK